MSKSTAVDLEREPNLYANIGNFENSAQCAVEPDIYYDEKPVDNQSSFLHILQWIRNGNNSRAKEIRLQAAYYFFSGGSKLSNKSQVALAMEIGSTKAAISQKAVELQEYFAEKLGLKDTMERVSRAVGMRSNEAREKFSQVCKSNHQKRKNNSSRQTSSQTKSELDTWRPPSLSEIASQRAGRL
jgi:hypothetical protein